MRGTTQTPAALTIATVLLTIFPYVITGQGDITGDRASCTNEGEAVAVDSIKDIACFKCICKNGFIECDQKYCPDVKNCYMQMPKEGCCMKCKGCFYNNVMHESGAEWTEPDDPCRILRCEAGVVTESIAQCYTPCDNPRQPQPGQCCQSCHGCYINGQKVSEGRDATLTEDPCLKCHCSKSKLTCVKMACPVLPCPVALQRTPPGECCPICSEGKQAKLFPDHTSTKPCILGKEYHFHNKSWPLDKCTKCICKNGTTICKRNTCPVLECGPEHQKTSPGECCPHCPPIEEVRSTCTISGKTYEDGESWRLDECKSCMCHSGEPRCAMEQCPTLSCPAGHRKERPPGQCCHRCIESDGVCTVFGDPHYKTFDGKFYNFQGSCKYQLTSDCVDHTFSIRVTNDGRSTRYSSWTKTVSLKLGSTKINLGRKLRIKVDGQRVQLPHNITQNLGTIVKMNNTVLVSTVLGVKVVWDGNGFLEVSAPTSYKKKLCGLCGNYNSIVRDDLRIRNGHILNGTSDAEIRKFGGSWQVGGKKACSRTQDNTIKQRPCSKENRRKGFKKCAFFNKSASFATCRHKLNPVNYYESCIMDMCECQTETCYCESFSAYARECQRIGVTLTNWKVENGCAGGSSNAVRGSTPKCHRHKHRTNHISLPKGFTIPPSSRSRRPLPIKN